ncbi:MAG: hypothetical protein IPL08_17965 [Saprospiraceae bacterium]|nr:hypothetical protein [Saprospiraceae bacterium]
MKEYQTIEDTETDKVKEPVIDYDKVYTYGDYLKLEIDEMVEIIRGKIFRMCDVPRIKHQIINGNIFYRLRQQLEGKKCNIFNALLM